jgi:hypothetical protein
MLHVVGMISGLPLLEFIGALAVTFVLFKVAMGAVDWVLAWLVAQFKRHT